MNHKERKKKEASGTIRLTWARREAPSILNKKMHDMHQLKCNKQSEKSEKFEENFELKKNSGVTQKTMFMLNTVH